MTLIDRNGTWQLRLRVPKHIQERYGVGARQWYLESTKTKDKAVAKRLEKQRAAELWAGKLNLGPKKGAHSHQTGAPAYTLADAWALAWKLHPKYIHSKSPETLHINYKIVADILGKHTPMADINVDTLMGLADELLEKGYAASTIDKKMMAVSTLLKLSVRWGKLASCPPIPLQRGSARTNTGKRRIITSFEQSELLRLMRADWSFEQNSSRPWDSRTWRATADLVEVLLDTGFRLSEALSVAPEDILDNGAAVVLWENKTSTPRTVPLTQRARDHFARHTTGTNPQQPIFGTLLTRSKVDHIWARVRAKMSLSGDKRFVVHSLRHTCCTRLLRAGHPLKTVQIWMGHADISTTGNIYAHLDTSDLVPLADTLSERSWESQ